MSRRGPLDAIHRALGAKMGAFGGWEMPIAYAGTVGEHEAVRERAGLFDVSHLGKIVVRGPDARAFLDRALSNRMADLPPGRARYSLILDDDGGIVDDLIVYGVGPDEYLVVPNASNTGEVERRVRATPGDAAVARGEQTTLAVQGPASTTIVGDLFPSAKDLGYMHVAREGDVVIARSGYTGEVGYEVFTSPEAGADVWERLYRGVKAAGGEACGLGARDTLRLEMGYPLHGNDISPQVLPSEAGLMWAVKPDGRTFPGADAMRTGQPRARLIGIRMRDRVIPRAGCRVLVDGAPVGRCTSGTFSPTLRVGIALASVDPALETDRDVEVEVRGKVGVGTTTRPPFVDRSPR